MASITERNGTYFFMVSTGYDLSGRQVRKTKTWKPEKGMTAKQIEKAVQEQAVLFEKKVLSGQVLDGGVTFADFVDRWRKDYAEPQLAPKTMARYDSMLKRILPVIGHIRLDKIQPHHLMELYNDMGGDVNRRGISFLAQKFFFDLIEKKRYSQEYVAKTAEVSINTVYNIFKAIPVAEQTAEKVCGALGLSFSQAFEPSKAVKGLSNKTIKHHHRLISAILNQAVLWQVIPSNPAQRVKPPKVDRTEAKFLDEKQTAKLLDLLESESIQNRTMIKLFIYSGLRRGELAGLEWSDIDFANHLLTVRRSSQYVSGKGIFTKGTKTETSNRTIKLPDLVFEMLKEYRVWQLEQQLRMGDRWVNSNRLFTQAEGQPIHPDSITGWFRDFISKTDLPKVSIHSLRHTNATLMIAAGVPLRTVSARMGHSKSSVTLDCYTHAIRTADEMAAGALDDILKPKVLQGHNAG